MVHALRGRPSNRKTAGRDGTGGDGDPVASRCTGDSGRRWQRSTWTRSTRSTVSRETVRQWMIEGRAVASRQAARREGASVAAAAEPLWRVGAVGHQRRTTGWKAAGKQIYLIIMIDDATSRLFARFVRHDSTEENMRLLGRTWRSTDGRWRFTPTRPACFRPR